MVLNYIWIAFFLIAFVVALVKLLFMGDMQVFTEIMNSTYDTARTGFEISLDLPYPLLWLGIMKIGERWWICFQEQFLHFSHVSSGIT